MPENVIIFPSISEQKRIDLKKASILTGLDYPLLYKLVVIQGNIGYYRYGRKIIVETSDVQNLMKRHYVSERKFNYDSKKANT